MIQTKTTKTQKVITSSYFDDIKLLRSSKRETDYREMYRESQFDANKLKVAYVVHELLLFKMGCRELSDHVSKLTNEQLKGLTTNYFGATLEVDEPITEQVVITEIADPDNEPIS
jgi:acyl-CoA hydrolase